MARRLTDKLRTQIREAANMAVQYYTATIAMHDDAPIVRYIKKHLDDDVPDTPGYLVQCWIFVPDDEEDD